MVELALRNKSIISKLDYIKDQIIQSDHYKQHMADPSTVGLHPNLVYSPNDAYNDGEKYLSREHLERHMADPDHQGFPVEHMSIPLNHLKECPHIEAIAKYVNGGFISEMGAVSSAVFLYYPPGGFVGWHTNQNNSGYQFIFSWSEKGDGYFQYFDKEKQEIVKLPDKEGWNARYYHFGKDEDEHCWHSAYTNVPRITVCVLFRWWDMPERKEMILDMKDQLIEDIEMEE